MRVILLQNIPNLGRKGEIKEVTVGYALNFLIPQKLAIKLTTVELEKLKNKIEAETEARKKHEEKLKLMAKEVEGLKLEIEERADENGTLYGGVDKKKIAELLKDKDIEIDPEKINLFSHLKKIGEHEVEIQVLPESKVKIRITIKPSV